MREDQRTTKKMGPQNTEQKGMIPIFNKGQVINSRYRIIENIGSGGFGKVFRATDLLLKKDVALKFLDPGIREDQKKFIRVQREINTSQKISDERVIKIFDIEYFDNNPFLIMEFIKGNDLKSILNDKKNSNWNEFRPVYIEILKGIKTLHDKNIIHRDIKPSNIIITSEGKVKIIDFGLSKELGDSEKTSSVGEMIGSPKYMSPEQIRGDDLDQYSDIYQLGLLLYYILSRRKSGGNSSSTIEQLMERINTDPRKVYGFETGISGFLKYGIHKALESEKKLRFRSVEEMIDYFSSGRVSMLKLISKFFKREKKSLYALIAVIAIMGSISFIYLKGSRIMSEMDIDGSELVVSNKFGVNLFKKNFSPMKIRNVIPLEINSNFKRLRQRVYKDSYLKRDLQTAAVFLSKENLYKEIINLSIKSEKFSSKVSLLDSYGNKVYTQIFHLKNDYLQRSLFSGWMDFVDIKSDDLDSDGRDEIHFSVYQNMSMYPSGFCIIDKQDFHIVYNYGHIERFFFYKGDSGEKRILLIGMSNLFSHFRFICDIDISKTTNIQLPPFLNENLNRGSPKFSYMLIPHRSGIISNKWEEGGAIIFKSHSNNSVYKLNKNWDLSITEKGKVSVYKDDDQRIADMLYFLSKAYQKKVIKKSRSNSDREIKQALELNLSNPMFKSVINYFGGDLNLSAGNYSEAERYFNDARNFQQENHDIDQKMAELYFLTDQKTELMNVIEYKSGGFSKFFGLGEFGIKLFKIYIFLNSGEFRSALDLSGSYKKAENYVKGMISLFKGDYTKSLTESSRLIGNRTTPFTLSEARLLYSRSVLLNYILNIDNDLINHKDVKLSEFYFTDIAVNSLLDGHLAAMSRSFFIALNGDKKGAERYSNETLEKLLTDSRGDMFTKLWLFYDSFVYGKTMEKIGNKKEAIRGYQLSIKSNPYTDIAERAKVILKSLKK